ncbi:hypothetical protein C8J57DRAFT_1641510 [Mycena rebaudengoi]|nr:hypothetical protein C8J57DRAFT_1641510 [Mycena rebaudengoi]
MVPPLEAKKSKGITEPVTIDLQDPPGQVTSRIDPSNQIHMISCDLCGTEIRTTRAANRYNFIKHRQSCKQKLHLKQAQSQTLRKSPLGTPDFLLRTLEALHQREQRLLDLTIGHIMYAKNPLVTLLLPFLSWEQIRKFPEQNPVAQYLNLHLQDLLLLQ